MKRELELGTLMSGAKFTLPLEAVTRTFALIAIRGWGKTIAATVMAEEMCEAGLPWIALDPVGVWWGLRCNPDGSPGGYPVVILGGQHADLPLEKEKAASIADAILQENVSCVIDLKLESKNTARGFIANFCDRLMELSPAVPRMIFLEEAPEFVPQKPLGEQKRSLAAVERLVRLGRNQGYGATLISQRYATVQKDVLTQCESLLAGRAIGKHDRDACRDWIAEVVAYDGKKAEGQAEKFLESLARLQGGQGWFWSPQWLDVFHQVRIRRRKTYHPGETRTVGQAPKQVALSDVRDFVERFQKVLTTKPAAAKPERGGRGASRVTSSAAPFEPATPLQNADLLAAQQEAASLRAQVAELHRKLGAANAALAAVRQAMEPDYRALQKLFADLDAVGAAGNSANAAAFEPWKHKLGAGCGKIIDALLEREELATPQLATLTGLSPRTCQNNLIALRRNGLVESSAGRHRLREI